MAFTKKFAKKAPAPKAAASYARKKAQAEVEEVEEVDEVEEVETEPEQEEVQDDYDEQEAAPTPAPRRGFSRPAAPARPAPRQFSNGGGHGANNGEQKKALRLTGLFAGKREGCFSGKLRTEDAENLAALIEEANSTNQQVVFFLWENQGNPQFSLTANISAPFQKGFSRGGGGFNRGGSGGNGGGFRKRW